jgi:hypothetical protein
LGWIQQSHHKELRPDLLAEVARGIAKTDLPTAMAILPDIPAGRLLQRLIPDVFLRWVASDAAAAFSYLNLLPESPQRSQFIAAIKRASTKTRPGRTFVKQLKRTIPDSQNAERSSLSASR